jgi:hypothetical protein
VKNEERKTKNEQCYADDTDELHPYFTVLVTGVRLHSLVLL